MNRWFFPSWSGDFRLEADGEASVLTVVNPTPDEIAKLDIFLREARKKKWVGEHVGFVPDGEVKIKVAAPVPEAGLVLRGNKFDGKLTVVRSDDGEVTATWSEVGRKEKKRLADEKKGLEEERKKLEKAKDAATVRRPTLCCPNPLPGPDVRASEALQAFCTARQWSEWLSDGLLHCRGNLSGRLYQILHRHHPLAAKRGKIVWDVESGNVLHCYDWSVPPAEEVLAMKLVLEHAEHWIRNLSGCLVGTPPIYHNPFMDDVRQLSDGLADAAFMRAIGNGFLSLFAPSGRNPN